MSRSLCVSWAAIFWVIYRISFRTFVQTQLCSSENKNKIIEEKMHKNAFV